MTKDEAKAAIHKIRDEYGWFSDVQRKITAIIDQIEPDFTVRELVTLLKQARDGTSEASIDIEEIWTLASVGAIEHEGQGVDSLRAKLLELVKPPMAEQKTIMVEMPLFVARDPSAFDYDVTKACRAALEKAKL